MYDGLTGRYSFHCPEHGEVALRLSAFRVLERLPGAAHPAVYKVVFACPCGLEHEGLVAHDDLDWAPLGASEENPFFNVMTARLESAAAELVSFAVQRISRGEWPWSFYCYPEDQPRPVFPSAFRVLAPGEDGIGVAVRCPSCARTSVNLVSREHVDVPFFHDRRVAVVEHVFAWEADDMLAAFREELDSGRFDARRRDLAA